MFFVISFLVGCELSEEEKQKRENYYAQASKNAINYVMEKYGFIGEFVSAKCSDEGKFGNVCDKMIIVDMKYNNKVFQVYISGVGETNDGMDNYQHDEIAADIAYEIQKIIGVVPYNYVIDFRLFGNNNFIAEYYDKKNLKEIVNNYGVKVLFEFIDDDKYKNNINSQILDLILDFFDNEKTIFEHKLYFVNYFSKITYDNAPNYAHYGRYSLGKLAFYVESYVSIAKGELQYHNLDLIKKDDLYFYVENKSSDRDVYISNTSLGDFDDWTYVDISKQVSNSYAINIDDNMKDIYVYVPANKYKKYNIDNLSLVYQTTNGNIKSYYDKDFSELSYDQINNCYVEVISVYDWDDEVKLAIVEKTKH